MSQKQVGQVDPAEVTHDQLVLLYKAEKARRQKLEEQIDDLSEKIDRVNSLSCTETVVNQLVAALVNDKEAIDFAANPMQNREALSDVGTRLDSVESKTKEISSKLEDVYDGSVDGPTDAWNKIVEHANRMRRDPEHKLPKERVKLYKENVSHATGKTERQAANYIERFGEEKEGTDWQKYQRGNPTTNRSPRRKALIIDLDVWGDGSVE